MACNPGAEHYIIYGLINKFNQKIYVGQTTRSLQVRIQEHQSEKSGCIKLRHAIKKYGINNFDIQILSSTNNLMTANFLESFYIKIFDSIENGYNLMGGGSNGKASKETRELMSKQRKGEKNPMFGKHHTQTAKDNISIKKKGKPGYWKGKSLPQEVRNKVSNSRKGLTAGEKNPGAKLTLSQVYEIKILLQNPNYTQKQIWEMFSISRSQLQRIKSGKSWK